jgi:hypothetical protein
VCVELHPNLPPRTEQHYHLCGIGENMLSDGIIHDIQAAISARFYKQINSKDKSMLQSLLSKNSAYNDSLNYAHNDRINDACAKLSWIRPPDSMLDDVMMIDSIKYAQIKSQDISMLNYLLSDIDTHNYRINDACVYINLKGMDENLFDDVMIRDMRAKVLASVEAEKAAAEKVNNKRRVRTIWKKF